MATVCSLGRNHPGVLARRWRRPIRPSPTILPDAYVEIVINLGGSVTLDGQAFHGTQPARTVVGLLVNILNPLGRVCQALDDRLAAVVDAHPHMESGEARDAIERVFLDHLRRTKR
jgi:hypothetical protein